MGILLDTNALSELMRPAPEAKVLAWFQQQGAPFFTSTITRAEILLGIALLPEGKRREALATAGEKMFVEDFTVSCLAFDDEAAAEYALLVAAVTGLACRYPPKMEKSPRSPCATICRSQHAMSKTLRGWKT